MLRTSLYRRWFLVIYNAIAVAVVLLGALMGAWFYGILLKIEE